MTKPTGSLPKIDPIRAASTPPNILSGLSEEQTKRILQVAEQRKCQANRVIVRGGDRATHFYLLTQGQVKYYRLTKKGEEVPLWWLTAGDCFGIGSLLGEPLQYVGTAQTIDDCELLVWSGDRIRSLAATHHVLAENALNIVLHYLGSYVDRAVGLATERAEQRLANTLLQLARRLGTVREGGVELAMMNEDLAALAHVSAFTASRQLKDWERQGIVHKTRGKVMILSPERLLID